MPVPIPHESRPQSRPVTVATSAVTVWDTRNACSCDIVGDMDTCITSRRSRSACLLCCLALLAGCNLIKGDKDLPPGATAADEVGRPLPDFELPVSLRLQDAAPSPTDSRQIEATDEQLRIDGSPVVALTKGRVAAVDQVNGI